MVVYSLGCFNQSWRLWVYALLLLSIASGSYCYAATLAQGRFYGMPRWWACNNVSRLPLKADEFPPLLTLVDSLPTHRVSAPLVSSLPQSVVVYLPKSLAFSTASSGTIALRGFLYKEPTTEMLSIQLNEWSIAK